MKERHTKSEVEQRVLKCYELRFETSPGMSHTKWQEYCQENYDDRSQQQYTEYWMKASQRYKEVWKEKLDTLIDPAVDKLFELLASDNEKISQDAVTQVFKLSGNITDRLEADVNVTSLKTTWGLDGEDS